MKINDLRQLYLAELEEARSFEDQVSNTLSGLAERASNEDLKAFLQNYARQERNHCDDLRRLLDNHAVEAGEHDDRTMRRILDEAQKWADQIDGRATRDAALIASAQRIQHYKIAVYGSLAAWAKQEGLDDDLEALLSILDDEKKADAKLSKISKDTVNSEAH